MGPFSRHKYGSSHGSFKRTHDQCSQWHRALGPYLLFRIHAWRSRFNQILVFHSALHWWIDYGGYGRQSSSTVHRLGSRRHMLLRLSHLLVQESRKRSLRLKEIPDASCGRSFSLTVNLDIPRSQKDFSVCEMINSYYEGKYNARTGFLAKLKQHKKTIHFSIFLYMTW